MYFSKSERVALSRTSASLPRYPVLKLQSAFASQFSFAVVLLKIHLPVTLSGLKPEKQPVAVTRAN